MRQFETENRVLATIYISFQLMLVPLLDGFPFTLTMHIVTAAIAANVVITVVAEL